MSAPWHIAPVSLPAVRRLSAELGVSRVLAEVLVRRGLQEPAAAAEFLDPDFRLHDPYLLHGVTEARRRIDRALQRDEHIVVHGDYDADGVTATYVLHGVLSDLGASVSGVLPNRFVHGYGLSVQAVEEAAAAGAGLLITVDCGSRDAVAVARARQLGIDVIVTDHHQLGEELPDCIVVSPSLGCYPSPFLAGCGVAFKLAHALLEERGDPLVEAPLRLRRFLDAVALGTIADVVPLVGENRRLALLGLARLRSDRTPGMAALMDVAGVDAEQVTAQAVSFRLAPRINAAGRLGDAPLALRLLQAPDAATAMELALQLNECNEERQRIEQRVLEQALQRVPDPVPPALVLADPGWHEGVVGIVAARVAERCHRPTVLLCSGDEVAKGSGRSVPGFDLLAAVSACSELLVGYGGHKAACGVRIRPADIDAFRLAFQEQVAESMGPELLTPGIGVDAVVAGDELTLQLAEELERLAPYGEANRQVTLLLHGACVESPRLTRDGRHLRCRVRCDGACSSAVHFDFSDIDGLRGGRRYDVPLELVTDRYNGSVSPQARVRALVPLPGDEACGEGCRVGSAGRPAAGAAAGSHRASQAAAADLCATGCTAACPLRVTGAELAAALQVVPDLGLDDLHAGAADRLRKEDRLIDLCGRPVLSVLTSLLAGEGSSLVLVADVARRRPLLSRDVPLAALGAAGAYLHGACAARRAADLASAAAEARWVVMADAEAAAAAPELLGSVRRAVFLDPPFSQATADAVCAGLAADAELYRLWSPAEAEFTQKVLSRFYDLDAALRTLWQGLQETQDPGAALEQQLTRGELLPPPLTTMAAARTLAELGLLPVGDGEYLKRRADAGDPATGTAAGTTHRSASETYRAWRRRYDKAITPHLTFRP